MMTHSVIRNSNQHYKVATTYFFQDELFALFCSNAPAKKRFRCFNISLLIKRQTLNKIDTKRSGANFSTFQKAAKNAVHTLCGLTSRGKKLSLFRSFCFSRF